MAMHFQVDLHRVRTDAPDGLALFMQRGPGGPGLVLTLDAIFVTEDAITVTVDGIVGVPASLEPQPA